MYCFYCGKEIGENAYVCLNCGALIKKPPKQEDVLSKDDSAMENMREETKFKICNGISYVLLFITTFLFLMGSGIRNTSFYENLANAGLVFSIITLVVSTVTLFWTLKEKNFGSKWAYVFVYSIAVFLFIFGVVLVSSF